jgi:uncharacterized membrane protein
MMSGMMWGMGLFWLLVVIVLILAAAALIKYLRTGSKESRQGNARDHAGRDDGRPGRL